jgi:hypothetical protein
MPGALPTTHCRVPRYLSPEGGEGELQRAPQDFTSWEAIYRTLAAALPSDRYYRGATLMAVLAQPPASPPCAIMTTAPHVIDSNGEPVS